MPARAVAFRATLVIALIATGVVELPHAWTAAGRAYERAATPIEDRERGEERVIVTLILDALAKRPPSERLALLLPRAPAAGDEDTYLVFRLRVKLYPRPLDVAYRREARWWPLDLDYRRTAPAPAFADIVDALKSVDTAIVPSELAGELPAFKNATPAGAFGFRLLERSVRP